MIYIHMYITFLYKSSQSIQCEVAQFIHTYKSETCVHTHTCIKILLKVN